MKTTLLFMFLVFVGCSGSSGSGSDEDAVTEDRETVFDPMIRSIDKANQVEQQVFDQKEKMDEALKEMEGEPQG